MAKLGDINFGKEVYSKGETDSLLDGKQDVLTFDDTPTEGSSNPVKSGGIRSYVDVEIEEALAGLGSVLRYRGVVPNEESLPTENVKVGDVYTVESDGSERVCVGIGSDDLPEWSDLGPTLSGYLTKEEAERTYMPATANGDTILTGGTFWDRAPIGVFADKITEGKASSFTLADKYFESSSYEAGDVVLFMGNIYECNTSTPSPAGEFNPQLWSVSNVASLLRKKQDVISDLDEIRSGAAAGATAVQPGDLGTAASKDVPATGNASAAQVVLGSDTRLSDARSPTAHTHSVGDITLPSSIFSEGDLLSANNKGDIVPYYAPQGILAGNNKGEIVAGTPGTDYVDPASLATVATTGAYSDLTGRPTNVSSFTNDAGYITSGDVPTAYASAPEMDGTASAGASTSWARGDHVHPTDASRASQSDMSSLESGLDDAITLLNNWNGTRSSVWTLTMDDGTVETRVVLDTETSDA